MYSTDTQMRVGRLLRKGEAEYEEMLALGSSALSFFVYTLLQDFDPSIRAGAALALGEIGDERAVEPLINALGDRNGTVRSNAAATLGKIGEPAVLPLLKALKDEDGEVRSIVVYALGRIGDKRAIDPLLKALGDRNGTVREKSAEALIMLGEKALPQLLKKAADPTLREKAMEIIHRLEKALELKKGVISIKLPPTNLLRNTIGTMNSRMLQPSPGIGRVMMNGQ